MLVCAARTGGAASQVPLGWLRAGDTLHGMGGTAGELDTTRKWGSGCREAVDADGRNAAARADEPVTHGRDLPGVPAGRSDHCGRDKVEQEGAERTAESALAHRPGSRDTR